METTANHEPLIMTTLIRSPYIIYSSCAQNVTNTQEVTRQNVTVFQNTNRNVLGAGACFYLPWHPPFSSDA